MSETEIRKIPFGVWVLPLLVMAAIIFCWMPSAIRNKKIEELKAILERQKAQREANALKERDIIIESKGNEIIIPKGYTLILRPYNDSIQILPAIYDAGDSREYDYDHWFILGPDEMLTEVSIRNGKRIETQGSASPRWQGINSVEVRTMSTYPPSPVKVHVRFE